MNRPESKGSNIGKMLLSSALLMSLLALMAPLVPVSAATPVVTATPGYINFGMSSSIALNAPAAGSYTVIVTEPNGASTSLTYTATAAGQIVTNAFGTSSGGFATVVNQVGTYNIQVLQGATVVGSTSFVATNRIVITMDMVTGGNCYFIDSEPRGYKFIPRFYASYASTGAFLNVNTTGVKITFTQPDNKTVTTAAWDSGALLFRGIVSPAWNYTYVGAWQPTVTAIDGFGNTGTYTYGGLPAAFAITPATLSTSITLTDVKTNAPVASIYPGESISISATVTYPTNPEPVTGFVTGLDSVARGGVVNAVVGYGPWNFTSNTFGTTKIPGGVLGAAVKLTNTNGVNGTWTGQFTVPSSLPTLAAGASFGVAVTSADKAQPPNTGLQVNNVGLAPTPATSGTATSTTTVTSAAATVTSTATQTIQISGTQTLIPSTSTTTVTAPGATSTSTSTTTMVSTMTSTTQAIPTIAYAGMIVLLIIGLAIGMIVRMPRK